MGNPVFFQGSPQASLQTGLGERKLTAYDFSSGDVDLTDVSAAPISLAWGPELTFLNSFGPRAFIVESITGGTNLELILLDGSTVVRNVSGIVGVEQRIAITGIDASNSDLVGNVIFVW